MSKLKNKSSEIFIEALLQSESNLEQDLETSLKRAYIITRLAQNTLSLSIDEKIKIQQDFFTSIYKAVCKKVNSRKPFLHFTKKDFDDKTAEFIRRVLIFAWSNSHELIFEKNIKAYLKDMRLSYEEFNEKGKAAFERGKKDFVESIVKSSIRLYDEGERIDKLINKTASCFTPTFTIDPSLFPHGVYSRKVSPQITRLAEKKSKTRVNALSRQIRKDMENSNLLFEANLKLSKLILRIAKEKKLPLGRLTKTVIENYRREKSDRVYHELLLEEKSAKKKKRKKKTLSKTFSKLRVSTNQPKPKTSVTAPNKGESRIIRLNNLNDNQVLTVNIGYWFRSTNRQQLPLQPYFSEESHLLNRVHSLNNGFSPFKGVYKQRVYRWFQIPDDEIQCIRSFYDPFDRYINMGLEQIKDQRDEHNLPWMHKILFDSVIPSRYSYYYKWKDYDCRGFIAQMKGNNQSGKNNTYGFISVSYDHKAKKIFHLKFDPVKNRISSGKDLVRQIELQESDSSNKEFQFIGTYSFKYVDKLIMITMEKTGVMFTLFPL